MTEAEARHRAEGGGTALAAELSAHRLHAQLVLHQVDAALDAVLTLLDGPVDPDVDSASEWLRAIVERLPLAMGTRELLRVLVVAESCLDQPLS
jgi:hypothetical protein